jgi:hypothetical protein
MPQRPTTASWSDAAATASAMGMKTGGEGRAATITGAGATGGGNIPGIPVIGGVTVEADASGNAGVVVELAGIPPDGEVGGPPDASAA